MGFSAPAVFQPPRLWRWLAGILALGVFGLFRVDTSLRRADSAFADGDGVPSTQRPLPALPPPPTKKKPAIIKINRGCGLALFYHIPKCGGTTIETWLRAARDKGQLARIVNFHNARSKDQIDYDKFWAANLEDVVKKPPDKLVAVVVHHHGPSLYRLEEKFPEIKRRLHKKGCALTRFTFLREPLDRLISMLYFHWQRHKKNHRFANSTRASVFRDLLSKVHNNTLAMDGEVANGQLWYILNNKDDRFYYPPGINAQALHSGKRILSDFEFVGTTAKLEKGARKIGRKLGIDVPFPKPQNKGNTKRNETVVQAELPDDVQWMLDEFTVWDNKLYEWAIERFDKKK